MLRAVLEGIILNIYEIAQALEQKGAKVEEIYANGGFTKNPLAMQILADVFNAKIYLQEHEEGAAWGAAILAFQAMDMAIVQDIPTEASFIPSLEAHQKYQNLYNIWKHLYAQLKGSFEALEQL